MTAVDPMIGSDAQLARLVELAEGQLTALRAVRSQLVAVQAELSAVARHLQTPPPRGKRQPPEPPESPLRPVRAR